MGPKGQLLIDFSLFEENFSLLRGLAGPGPEVLLMVKANAYGHGIGPIVQRAWAHCGARGFGCATVAEGVFLRKHLPGESFEVYVFSDFDLTCPQQVRLLGQWKLIPVIFQLEDLETFLQHRSLSCVPLAIKLNTGMNRLGIFPEQLPRAIDLLKSHGRRSIHHLMSHFACAPLPMDQHPQNLHQREVFQWCKSELRAQGISLHKTSLANSGAIEQKVGLEESHIRPGLMLYGPRSFVGSPWKGKMISALEGRILQQYSIQKGAPIGYGGTLTPHSGSLAMVSLGYGDGIGQCYRSVKVWDQKGEVGQIVGAVSMDMVAVLSEVPLCGQVKFWDEDPLNFEQVAQQTGLLPYEILCAIGARVGRVYRSGPRARDTSPGEGA